MQIISTPYPQPEPEPLGLVPAMCVLTTLPVKVIGNDLHLTPDTIPWIHVRCGTTGVKYQGVSWTLPPCEVVGTI